jgi:multidrug efflux pump subunit AcrB
MFVTLLIVTFVIALAMSTLVAFLFARPITKILSRLVSEELAPTWRRYILFAIYVVGISGGVRLWDIEKYITPDKEGKLLQLTSERWIIEVYKSVIDSLQSIAWMLLIFFLFALISYVIVRGFEMKRQIPKSE